MNYELWKLFLEVAEQGRLSKVALTRGVSQPHLSRLIAELEQQSGGRLFARTGRGLTLTELGLRVAPKIRVWMSTTEALEQDIRAVAHQPMGRVKLGIIPSMAHPFVSNLCLQMRKQFPLVQLSVREGQGAQLEHWLGSGELDLAILLRDTPSNKDALTLGTTDTYFVSSAKDPLTKDGQIAFRSLHDLPLVSFCRPSTWRDSLEQRARKLGIRLNVVFEADSFAVQLGIAQRGGAYALLGFSAIQTALEHGRVRAAKLTRPSIARPLTLAHAPTGSITPAIRTVMQVAQSLAKLS